jgi:repressor LexA
MKTQEALNSMRTFFKTNKRLPTYQELADLLGFASKKASFELAKKLIEAGFIEKDSKGKLVPKKLFAPIGEFGFIKAGSPTAAEEGVINTLSLDEFMVDHPDSSFILKVSGDSMIEAGINSGDMVIVDKSKPVQNGDIVVANVDNEWTLKYFSKEKGQVCLIPANKALKNIYPRQSLSIGGVVTGVVRKYN